MDSQEKFQIMISSYSFKVRVEFLSSMLNIEFIDAIVDIEAWLKENINRNSYLAFPDAENWQYCLFNNEEDAVLFKLVWA